MERQLADRSETDLLAEVAQLRAALWQSWKYMKILQEALRMMQIEILSNLDIISAEHMMAKLYIQ